MLSLLCACLLLVACASEGSFDMEQEIRDIRTKVMEMWQEVTAGQAACGSSPDPTLYASCEVRPSASLDASQPQVTGLVLFRQLAPRARLDAFFALEGFPAEPNVSRRAIHVHEFGDVSQGCESTGPHYNPLAVQHPWHPGDFGNFDVRNGSLWKHRANLTASLSGPHSIVGRAVVVHAGEDDMGRGGNAASLENGNAGRRLACCVVGLCGPARWERQAREHGERRKRHFLSLCPKHPLP